jgi:hypothetical protein
MSLSAIGGMPVAGEGRAVALGVHPSITMRGSASELAFVMHGAAAHPGAIAVRQRCGA